MNSVNQLFVFSFSFGCYSLKMPFYIQAKRNLIIHSRWVDRTKCGKLIEFYVEFVESRERVREKIWRNTEALWIKYVWLLNITYLFYSLLQTNVQKQLLFVNKRKNSLKNSIWHFFFVDLTHDHFFQRVRPDIQKTI